MAVRNISGVTRWGLLGNNKLLADGGNRLNGFIFINRRMQFSRPFSQCVTGRQAGYRLGMREK